MTLTLRWWPHGLVVVGGRLLLLFQLQVIVAIFARTWHLLHHESLIDGRVHVVVQHVTLNWRVALRVPQCGRVLTEHVGVVVARSRRGKVTSIHQVVVRGCARGVRLRLRRS